MSKKQATKQAGGHATAGELKMIPLAQIELAPQNTRKQTSEKALAALAASIKRDGVLQAILVRELPAEAAAGKVRYQVVAGERRFRAATRAGLKEIPAQVRIMTESETLCCQIIENLQREEVHPLDEADGFLRLQQTIQYSLRRIAESVAKDVRYVARRLSLTNLIAEARKDFLAERLTLGHALELSRLAPEIQSAALTACFPSQPVLQEQTGEYEMVADKTQPAYPVRQLQQWLEQNVHLNLQTAPFALDDARLREDGLTCLACPQRTGRDRALFADIKHGDICLNPLCFQGKQQMFVQLNRSEAEQKHKSPVPLLARFYGAREENETTLRPDQYRVIAKKAERCAHAEPAVYGDGPEIGKTKWICREPACPDHWDKAGLAHAGASNGQSNGTAAQDRSLRRQELFEIRVNEATRKRALQASVQTFAWPLERPHLNEIAKEFFRRLPSSEQKTVGELLGWETEKANKLCWDEAVLLAEIATLEEKGLAQLLVLCSVAHVGANPNGNRQVDQSAVTGLCEARGVNYALLDAEVRAELCPKRYREAHLVYLARIKRGETATIPVVYERPPTPPQRAEESGSNSASHNGAQPGRRKQPVKAAA